MKNMLSRKHLCANGLLLLQELHHMYKPKNAPEAIAAKPAEFRSKMKRSIYETVDDYYNRFHKLLDDVNDFRETVTKMDAIHLPADWKTDDWPTLLILRRDYYNSLHPNGLPSKKDNHSVNNAFASKQDQINHQKKIRLWFMNPEKFKNDLEVEQQKYSGRCIYHLCDNHLTQNCNVKRECEKLLTTKKSSPSPLAQTGQLRHISKESLDDDIVSDSNDAFVSEDMTNDTNEASLYYFACVINHYLCLVRSSSNVNPQHAMQYPIIADSGTNYHMFRDPNFFEFITPATGRVLLGDGKTALEIKSIGTIKLQFGDTILSIDNVRYIPSLAESINSLFLHIQNPGHAVHSSFEDGLYIIFPEFQTKAIIGHDDIYLAAHPVSATVGSSDDSPLCNSNISDSIDCCRHVVQSRTPVQPDSHKDENLLATLHQYYKEIKTKRQLNLVLPAGFHQENDIQRTLRDAKLYHLSSPTLPDSSNLDTLPYISSSTSISSSDTTVLTDNTPIK
jgi:hypothetical protein